MVVLHRVYFSLSLSHYTFYNVFLTSGGAAGVVETDIKSDCGENGFVQLDSEQGATACVLCSPSFRVSRSKRK